MPLALLAREVAFFLLLEVFVMHTEEQLSYGTFGTFGNFFFKKKNTKKKEGLGYL